MNANHPLMSVPSSLDQGPMTLHLGGDLNLSNDQIFRLGQLNQSYRFERTGVGDLIIDYQTDESTHCRLAKLFLTIVNWAIKDRTGLAFEAGTSFVLPNGAMRSPDLAWVRKSRLIQIAVKKKYAKFLPICPDFVMLLVRDPDSLERDREKMREYLANGAQMGWILDPKQTKIHLFNQGEPELTLENPSSISGEPVLHGFSFHPDPIWRMDQVGEVP